MTSGLAVRIERVSHHGGRLPTQPGDPQGFVRVPIRAEVDHLPVSERPGVGERPLLLDPGVARLRSGSMDRDQAVTGSDDSLQLDCEALASVEPALRRPGDSLVAPILLADVVR